MVLIKNKDKFGWKTKDKMTQTTLMTLTAEADNTKVTSLSHDVFDIPSDVQNHLDVILDYYAANALKPHMQICGDPLHIASSLVIQLQKTLPVALEKSGKVVLDFMVGQIAAFCRENNAGRITFSFEFKR